MAESSSLRPFWKAPIWNVLFGWFEFLGTDPWKSMSWVQKTQWRWNLNASVSISAFILTSTSPNERKSDEHHLRVFSTWGFFRCCYSSEWQPSYWRELLRSQSTDPVVQFKCDRVRQRCQLVHNNTVHNSRDSLRPLGDCRHWRN